MIILGIDPGSTRIGYGIIKKEKGFSLIDYGTIEIIARERPMQISEAVGRVKTLIETHHPDLAAIENLYFAKNRKTALAVAHTRGALISIINSSGVPIEEYDPTTIKKTVTGYGNADKKSVAKLVALSLGSQALTGHDDAADALAVAITAGCQYRR